MSLALVECYLFRARGRVAIAAAFVRFFMSAWAALVVVGFFTELFKIICGRLRPDFLDRCKPALTFNQAWLCMGGGAWACMPGMHAFCIQEIHVHTRTHKHAPQTLHQTPTQRDRASPRRASAASGATRPTLNAPTPTRARCATAA
jgi:hypothetical protein